jgi:hypothetical protein
MVPSTPSVAFSDAPRLLVTYAAQQSENESESSSMIGTNLLDFPPMVSYGDQPQQAFTNDPHFLRSISSIRVRSTVTSAYGVESKYPSGLPDYLVPFGRRNSSPLPEIECDLVVMEEKSLAADIAMLSFPEPYPNEDLMQPGWLT